MKKALIAAAVAAAVCIATQQNRAAIIDDFTAPAGGVSVQQTVVGSNIQTQTGLGASAIGGQRQVNLTVTATNPTPASGAKIDINNAPGSTANLSSDADTDASDTFSYGVAGDLNADLTAGSATAFIVRLLSTDLASLSNSITISTTGSGTSTATFNIPPLVSQVGGPAAPFDVVIPYASFSGTANFANVDRIDVVINGPRSSDYIIDLVGTNSVPEPATLGLFVAPLALLARRRRA